MQINAMLFFFFLVRRIWDVQPMCENVKMNRIRIGVLWPNARQLDVLNESNRRTRKQLSDQKCQGIEERVK
jgi:hypothetical protein